MTLDTSRGEPVLLRPRGRTRGWLLALLLAAGPVGALLGLAKFTIGPARLELRLEPGAETTVVLDAVNHGDEPLRLKVYAFDFDFDADGGLQYGRSLSGARSCASWFRFNPQVLEVERAGGSEPVRATARVPPNASGTYWCVLFLEDVPPPLKPGSRAVAAQFNARVGSIVYVDVGPAAAPVLHIESLATAPAAENPEAVAEVVHASGGYLRPQGQWELLSADGSVLQREDVGFPLLPGKRLRLRWPIRQGAGRYTLRLSLDYGGPKRLVAETTITVSAPATPPAQRRS